MVKMIYKEILHIMCIYGQYCFYGEHVGYLYVKYFKNSKYKKSTNSFTLTLLLFYETTHDLRNLDPPTLAQLSYL